MANTKTLLKKRHRRRGPYSHHTLCTCHPEQSAAKSKDPYFNHTLCICHPERDFATKERKAFVREFESKDPYSHHTLCTCHSERSAAKSKDPYFNHEPSWQPTLLAPNQLKGARH
jgi:hypothetical protein